LDSAPEVHFDEITELAAEILQCPVSFIEFMDEERQWLKSKYGLPDEVIEMPRDIAICATTICQSDLLLVPDLSEDVRFLDNPMVTAAPNLRFYAGMPLITPSGEAIGTICTIDFEARQITSGQQEALRRLSHQVMSQLELRKTLLEMKGAGEKLEEMHQKLQIEKQRSDDLLGHILPKKVAEKLQENGKVEPEYFDEASILFSDFAGFTGLTETLSPKNLVDLLHQCFSAFDKIMRKYDIEKIKTIGDAYMCIAGITGARKGHAERLCLAALEMQKYLRRANEQREKLRMPRWEMRVGIHTGPVVSGVVGEDKFTFDVWGDAVNIAALMEKYAEIGKVNISESTRHRVKEFFELESERSVASEKKGELTMHAIRRIGDKFSEDHDGLQENSSFRQRIF